MKRLVLLGGGHSQAAVLKDFGERPAAGAEIVLVSPERFTPYSGMIPGLITGDYDWRACHIDLESLARFASARWIEDRGIGIDPGRGQVTLESGGTLDYDLLSVAIGSTPQTGTLHVSGDHAVAVKPIAQFLQQWERMRAAAREGSARRIALIGAGAAGVEVVLAMQHRLRQERAHKVEFALYTDMPFILPGHSVRVRRRVERVLEARGITWHCGRAAVAVSESGIEFADGSITQADRVIVATGAAAAPWLRQTGLALDGRGFLAIDDCLRSTSHPQVYASGDVATHIGEPRPKAGVYAVRQGPALARNLRRALEGVAPASFHSPRGALALLNCGDRRAIVSWGGLALEGRWVWHWKDRIDRRFMARYRLQQRAMP